MNTDQRIEALKERFVRKFKEEATDVFSSPGRIELLGNHTDHNNGKVLVSTIDLNILAVASKRDDNRVVFYSKGFPKMTVTLSRLKLHENEYGTSVALIRGVLFKMKQLGYKIGGFNVVSDSTIFKGAGVSSSAAFEILIGKIISYYYNEASIAAFKLAQIGQFAESVYFNKPCGLLDQSGIALGGINYIDFKYLVEPVIKNIKVKIPGYQFLLINTGDDHSKLTPCYAAIKDEMAMVSHYFGQKVLREVDEEEFYKHIDEVEKKTSHRAVLRATHYFEENKRVARAYEALTVNDFKTFFKMMDESGLSSYNNLQNCYVESEEEKLPQALKFVKTLKGEIYSRVHGGGFAGTMLVVIADKDFEENYNILVEKYGKNNVMRVALTENGTCHL